MNIKLKKKNQRGKLPKELRIHKTIIHVKGNGYKNIFKQVHVHLTTAANFIKNKQEIKEP